MRENGKIPVPWPQRWQAIRFRTLPVCVFVLSVGLTAWLWNRQLRVIQVTGEVYAQRLDIIVPIDGVLADDPYRKWKVYDYVQAGELIARLDDRPTAALIATVKQELEMAKAELDTKVEEYRISENDRKFERQAEADRLRIAIERNRIDLLQQEALLVADRRELERQNELLETAEGQNRKALITRLDYQTIQKDRDVVAARIKGHEAFIKQTQQIIKEATERLASFPAAHSADLEQALRATRAAIAYQEARLRELDVQRELLEIRAPISGRLTMARDTNGQEAVAALPGTAVRRGTVLFSVAAEDADYIVSYIRPNQRIRPEVGMQVAIRRRNSQEMATSQVDEIGPQVELVPPKQWRDQSQKTMEWGLPIRIPVPRSLRLKPGELVDLKFLTPTYPAQQDGVVPTRG